MNNAWRTAPDEASAELAVKKIKADEVSATNQLPSEAIWGLVGSWRGGDLFVGARLTVRSFARAFCLTLRRLLLG